MKIKILGAHNIASKETGCISLLIDDILAVDAGALVSSLSLKAQQNLKAVLLTHQHYDHIRDIPALGMNYYLHENTIDVYSTQSVYDILSIHLLNDILYPDYFTKPPEKPAIIFHTLEPGHTYPVAGYTVLPVAVKHAVPTVGYQITSADGKKIFYTADTGPGLSDCWREVSPDVLIIELSLLNSDDAFAHKSGHLTPSLLAVELESFREINGYLPRVVTVHMNPLDEAGIKDELAAAIQALDIEIQPGYEGMEIEV
jgi:ribonuclease BN (tRNA processing enzyme)